MDSFSSITDYSSLIFDLKCISVFCRSDLSDGQFQELANSVEQRTFTKDTKIMTMNEQTNASLYLVSSGSVWLQREGKAPVMLPSGCNFGEELLKAAEGMEFFTMVTAPYTVWAASDKCTCRVLTIQACRDVFDIDRAEKQTDVQISSLKGVYRSPEKKSNTQSSGHDSFSSLNSKKERIKKKSKSDISSKSTSKDKDKRKNKKRLEATDEETREIQSETSPEDHRKLLSITGHEEFDQNVAVESKGDITVKFDEESPSLIVEADPVKEETVSQPAATDFVASDEAKQPNDESHAKSPTNLIRKNRFSMAAYEHQNAPQQSQTQANLRKSWVGTGVKVLRNDLSSKQLTDKSVETSSTNDNEQADNEEKPNSSGASKIGSVRSLFESRIQENQKSTAETWHSPVKSWRGSSSRNVARTPPTTKLGRRDSMPTLLPSRLSLDEAGVDSHPLRRVSDIIEYSESGDHNDDLSVDDLDGHARGSIKIEELVSPRKSNRSPENEKNDASLNVSINFETLSQPLDEKGENHKEWHTNRSQAALSSVAENKASDTTGHHSDSGLPSYRGVSPHSSASSLIKSPRKGDTTRKKEIKPVMSTKVESERTLSDDGPAITVNEKRMMENNGASDTNTSPVQAEDNPPKSVSLTPKPFSPTRRETNVKTQSLSPKKSPPNQNSSIAKVPSLSPKPSLPSNPLTPKSQKGKKEKQPRSSDDVSIPLAPEIVSMTPMRRTSSKALKSSQANSEDVKSQESSRRKKGEKSSRSPERKPKKKSPKVISSFLSARKKFESTVSVSSGESGGGGVSRPPKNVFQQPISVPRNFEAPKYPKSEKEEKTIRKALDQRFVFQRLPDHMLEILTSAFAKHEVTAGGIIVQQGATDDFFYVISEGECEFEVDGIKLGSAKAGESFGEDALLYTSPRAATVLAKTDANVFRIDQTTFRQLLESESCKTESQKKQLLERIDFLQSVTPEKIQKLASIMTPEKFKKGDTVTRKDDFGRKFYLVEEGELECRDGKTENRTIGPGGYYGEGAVLGSGNFPKANVVAKTSGRAFSIDKAQYQKTVGSSTSLIPIEGRTIHAVLVLQRKSGKLLTDIEILMLSRRVKDQFYAAGETILHQGVESEAAIFFVRQGAVLSEQGRIALISSEGSHFGEDLFEAAKECKRITAISHVKAVAKDDCVCGILSIRDYYEVFGDEYEAPTRESKSKSPKDSKTKEDKGKNKSKQSTVEEKDSSDDRVTRRKSLVLKYDDLERRVCLGEGNFGQVWLCVHKTMESPNPYVLKIQSKYHLISEGEAEACIREKNVLAAVEHPFIVNLVSTFQDDAFVFMLLEFVQGGELFSLMRDPKSGKRIRLSEERARFYALGVADALAYLHDKQIVYRDLKPENVLIDAQGYPKLIDFGFAKRVIDKTYTLCGTPAYLPPEVVSNQGHSYGADHWQLGILIFEMLSCESPFFYEGIEQMELFRSIVDDYCPNLTDVSSSANDLVKHLLEKDPTDRIGTLARGERDILHHSWFSSLSLIHLRKRELEAPWKPNVKDPFDTSNFDDWSSLEDKILDRGPMLPPKHAKLFENF